jgi:hypothetical protein
MHPSFLRVVSQVVSLLPQPASTQQHGEVAGFSDSSPPFTNTMNEVSLHFCEQALLEV